MQVKGSWAHPHLILEQELGSFYVGNLAALEHNVHHHTEREHTFDGAAATVTYDRKGLLSATSDMGDVELAVSASSMVALNSLLATTSLHPSWRPRKLRADWLSVSSFFVVGCNSSGPQAHTITPHIGCLMSLFTLQHGKDSRLPSFSDTLIGSWFLLYNCRQVL